LRAKGEKPMAQKQLVARLTVDDLRALITEIVRQVVREETHRDYFINAQGIKVLYQAEEIEPDDARELNQDYAAITAGDVERIPGEQIEKELRELGATI
jgi:tRNA A37 threonylcarbamoyladenosine dehydratase